MAPFLPRVILVSTPLSQIVVTVNFVDLDFGPQVRFPVIPWGFFLEGEDSHGDHCLGSLVDLRFKVSPGTSYSYITIHLIGTT
jgi:hypothetical protein